MISLLLCSIIFNTTISPQNIFSDHYKIIPPLGSIKAFATSPINVFAVSDNYLLIIDKQNFTLERTILFDQNIGLLGYDPQYNDLWILNTNKIIQLSLATYNLFREYPLNEKITRLGVGIDYLYLAGVHKYALNKNSGEIALIGSFPGNLQWYERNSNQDFENYPFLNPYFFQDGFKESQDPTRQFAITSIYDDGMDLYVGTDGYGILKYNKVSWQKKRLVYGPLDGHINKIKKLNNKLLFSSASGFSYYPSGSNNWQYLRLNYGPTDLIGLDKNLFFSFENHLAQASGSVVFTISNIKNRILCLSSDEKYLYIGTNSGLFRLAKGTKEPFSFGPDRYGVYAILPMNHEIYVGGEAGFYKYDRADSQWSKLMGRGIKDIVQVKEELYLLSVDNQLVRYRDPARDSLTADSSWFPLPYFNIYDIATDNEVVYCASFSGVYYYEPATGFYRLIFQLPRVRYDYVFIADDNILAVSNMNIYQLDTQYRD